MGAWIPSWAAVTELAVMAGVMFTVGSWVSGKALDRAYENGWDRCALKIRRSQAGHLAAGLTLHLDDEGPYWQEPAEMSGQPDGRRAGGSREQLAPSGGDQGARPSTADPHPGRADESRPLAAAPNQSRLPNDQQVRAELAALAEDVPGSAEAPVWVSGGKETGPGHPDAHPLGWRDGVMLSDGLHWLADWRLDHQADAQAADEHIAAWVAESRAMLARASWQDRLLA